MLPALEFIGIFHEAFLALDLDGCILRANTAAAAAFGTKASELARFSLFELVDDPPERLRESIRRWSACSAFTPGSIRPRGDSGPLPCEGARYAPAGQRPLVLLKLKRRQEANKRFGELTRQVEALEVEVARRLRAEQELLEADRRKDEFLAILAHELRNPLAPMMHSAQLLKLADVPASIRDKCHAVIERQVLQLSRLVEDLLDVSRWTRGVVELRRETVSLSNIVRDAVTTSEPSLSAREHVLELKLPPADLCLHGDPARLVQALSNLLNNAAKYMMPAGKIGVTAEDTRDEILIRVSDQGIGIPEHMLERIFDLFVRADGSLERSSEGLGIGLTLARQIAEAHGGTIKAFSAGKNRGSEFVMRLPKHFKEAPVQAGGADTTTASGARGLRVLVVDDNRDAADSMAAMIGILGNDVRAAYSGFEVPELVASFRPELVFLDIGMPGMNGYDVCRELRRTQVGEVRIVALTGYGQESDHTQSREAGFDEHLVKPISLDALQRALTVARSNDSDR